MEKKSIGAFLSTLRKANGYTQEEVANRLFVSNKTISKWERDESSPDLAAIPVLAELFGVTCDEILRGERLPQGALDDGKGRAKAEKQAQHIVSRTMNLFKSVSSVAAALTLVGFLLHFVVAYTYFKPLVAFGLALLFLLSSILLEYLQLNHAVSALGDGMMLAETETQLDTITKRLHKMAFFVFAFNGWAFLLMLPMVTAEGLDYANSVLGFHSYLGMLPLILLVCLALTAAAVYVFRNWLGFEIDIGGMKVSLNQSKVWLSLRYKTALIQRLLWIQAALLLGTVFCYVAPYLFDLDAFWASIVLLTLLCPVGCLVTFIIWFRKGHKGLERLMLLVMSVRNFLFTVTVLLALKYISISYMEGATTPSLSLPTAYAWNEMFLRWMLIMAAYLAIKYFLVKRFASDTLPPTLENP